MGCVNLGSSIDFSEPQSLLSFDSFFPSHITAVGLEQSLKTDSSLTSVFLKIFKVQPCLKLPA